MYAVVDMNTLTVQLHTNSIHLAYDVVEKMNTDLKKIRYVMKRVS